MPCLTIAAMMTSQLRFAPESRALVQERSELANALGNVCGRIEELEALQRTTVRSCRADVHAADVITQLLEQLSVLREQQDCLEEAMHANGRALADVRCLPTPSDFGATIPSTVAHC